MSDDMIWSLAGLHEVVPTNVSEATREIARRWGKTAVRACEHEPPFVAVAFTPDVLCYSCAMRDHTADYLALGSYCVVCNDPSTHGTVLAVVFESAPNDEVTLVIHTCTTHYTEGR